MQFRQKLAHSDLSLRIDGIQPTMMLATGNIYAVVDEDDRYADALLWNTLLDTCDEGHSACLVSSDAATSMKQSGLEAGAQTALASRRLAVLEVGGDFERFEKEGRFQRLAAELQHWGAEDKRLLVIDGAERLFSRLDDATLRDWRAWAERRDNVVVLLFRQSGVNGNESIAPLLPLAHRFAGMARLKSRYGLATWEIFHWFSPAGLTAARSFPLRCNARHRLEVPDEDEAPASGVEPAADEMHVLALRSAFLPKDPPVTDWQMIDGNAEDMLAKAADKIAATVVLSFAPGADFRRLARCVYELRKRCGVRLKIVIREVNSRLRYSQETLAVRLGANLIVPAEISYPRFLSLTSMAHGQVFPHKLPATFEQAMRDATPDEELGYLPPREFSKAVASSLDRARLLQVQNVLLRLPLAYGLQPLDALRFCSIKRPGDLCASDDRSIYLFLYACRESDIDKTLDRLFGLPVSELFSTESRFLSARGIQNAMADFDSRHRSQAFPDLSAVL
jgi:cellulose biosynthesis protein BcsE